MASDHPFQLLFETFGRPPISHAESVNRNAYEKLTNALSASVEKPGRCILLKAPRAGHGKTHLLSRLQHEFGATHEFVPIQAASGYRIDAPSVIDDTLRRLVRPLPASGGLCVLDLLARKLFALALQPLVRSGEVPCQDREGALAALQNKPVETFDFHHPNAVTAHWARENFEVLGPRLSLELSQRSDLPLREVSFWVNALFRFSATPLDEPTRARVLAETVFSQAPTDSDGESMERLSALLGLLTSLVRVVLVADDLEGFSADETAALRFAAFLGSLRQSVERLDVILSLNQDIWDSAFVPRLSGGLADRLSEVIVKLEPLKEEEMVALLDSRAPGLGRDLLKQIDLADAGTHSRGLIRAAGEVWNKPQPAIESTVPAPVFSQEEKIVVPPAPIESEASPAPFFPEEKTTTLPPAAPAPFFVAPEISEPAFTPAAAPIPQPRALVSPVDATKEVSVVAENSPFHRLQPDAPAFNPFSKPEVAPAIQVAATEVPSQRNAWPEPAFTAAPEQPYTPAAKSPFEVETQPAQPPFQAFEPIAESPFRVEPKPEASTANPFFIPEHSPVAASISEASQPAFQAFQPAQEFPQNPNPFFTAEPVKPAVAAPSEPAHASPFRAEPQPAPVAGVFQAFQPAEVPSASAAPIFQAFQAENSAPAAPVFQAFQAPQAAPISSPNPVPAPQSIASPFSVEPAQRKAPVYAPAEIVHPAPAASPFAQAPPVASGIVENQTSNAPACSPQPPASDADRVDELLRQFRERYGKGGL